MKTSRTKTFPLTLEEIFEAAAKAVPKSRVPPHPPEQARAGLLALLDRWEVLTATPGMQAERHELADKIMDVFASYPHQAPTWQSAWRKLHATKPDEENRR